MLDLLYAQVVAARRRWFERHPEARRRLQQPVISIGNLSMGGTAKTPMVALVAQWLISRGERPAILSRGYGRRDRRDGVVVVSDGRRMLADLDRAGDEPLMLARAVPEAIVAVAEDRFLAGVIAERRFGATVHILDDGFQHLHLARDLDVLMTTAGVTNERALPFGRLRESIDAAARADIVVVLDTDAAGARSVAWTLGISQSVAGRRVLASPKPPNGGEGGTPSGSFGELKSVVAVAGIANPTQFFQMLRDAGYPVAAALSFPDHHRYSAADAARVAAALHTAGGEMVVTTEKDLVRWDAVSPLPFACMAVPMKLEIDGWDALSASIAQAFARAREVA